MKFNYCMSGTCLKSVESATYLGVELSNDLSWRTHINKISGKATRTLNLLRRNLYKAPTELKSLAVTSLVRPALEYSSTVWDPFQYGHIHKLQSVQRRAARFVCGNYSRDGNVTGMLDSLK